MTRLRGVAATAVLLLLGGDASGLTIETNFVEAGSTIPAIGLATQPPPNSYGGGDLEAIVRAAADAWEALIDDDHELQLSFGWFSTTGVSNAGFHVGIGASGAPQRQTVGSLAFNSDPANDFEMFLDATPGVHEEFRFDSQRFADLGAGPIETSRQFVATDRQVATRIDLYTTALHEIGHALGVSTWAFYQNETADGYVDVTTGPYAGSRLPIRATHLETPESLLSPSRFIGQRRDISQIDLLTVCQLSRFSSCQLDVPAATFAGDYNDDGVTNAADYTVWRDALAASPPLPDGDGDGVINDRDYNVWAVVFGAQAEGTEPSPGDYNRDGVVNAADYTLWRDAAALTPPPDADGDGVVTRLDYNAWAGVFGERAEESEPLATDYNRDGVVNAADYTLWRDAAAVVPPPDGDRDGFVTGLDYEVWTDAFGALSEGPEPLRGDYNRDGVVNAADYTLWRDAAMFDTTPDGNGDGAVTASDYGVWGGNFGWRSAGIDRPATGVPEPAAAGLLVVAASLASAVSARCRTDQPCGRASHDRCPKA